MEFDLNSGRGWRRAMRRATVRHLTIRAAKVTKMVAGAVAAEGERRDGEEEVGLVEALACGKRDLFPEDVFEIEFEEPMPYAVVEDEAELVAVRPSPASLARPDARDARLRPELRRVDPSRASYPPRDYVWSQSAPPPEA